LETYILAKGLHAPYNLGEAVILRNLVRVMFEVYGDQLKVISLVDHSRYQRSVTDPRVSYVEPTCNFYVDSLRVAVQALRSIPARKSRATSIHVSGISHLAAMSILRQIGGKLRLIPHFYLLQHSYMTRHFAELNNLSLHIQSRLASGAITTSPAIASALKSFGFGQVHHIPPPTDVEALRPGDKRLGVKRLNRDLQLSINVDSFVMVYLGHINPLRFPYEVLLRAARMLGSKGVPWEFVVLTPSFRRNALFAKEVLESAKNLRVSDRVHIAVVDLAEDAKAAAYNAGDLVLFPSHGPTAVDPPLTVLEAMACGRVVLASPVQSVPLVITQNENGLLADFRSPKETCELMYSLYRDEERRGRIGAKARSLMVDQYSMDKVKEKICTLAFGNS